MSQSKDQFDISNIYINCFGRRNQSSLQVSDERLTFKILLSTFAWLRSFLDFKVNSIFKNFRLFGDDLQEIVF